MLPVTPSFRLDGQRALVTGAGRGIGAGLAAALAQGGAEVMLVSRTAPEIDAVAEEIRATGGQARAVKLDVTHLSEVAEFFSTEKPFDVLVNNAGTNRPKPMQEVVEADYHAVIDLNVKSAFFVAQAVARALIKAGRTGSLIHVGSQMGHVGGPNRSLYCASKWALEGMSKAFALDLAPYGIRSNTIAPTFIETPMTTPFLRDPDFHRDVLARIKVGRLGRVEDLMGAALFLASPASALITGTSIIIDGGWTAD